MVLSPTFRVANDLSYAVCYGVPILKPDYLSVLVDKMQSSWKKITDSQDSFALPDIHDVALRPELDGKLPAARQAVESWLPDPSRRELFKGWMMFGLRGKGVSSRFTFPSSDRARIWLIRLQPPVERRWITAMGAEWEDADVVTHPLTSAQDLSTRLALWLDKVDATVGRSRAIVAHFYGIKDSIVKSGVDFDRVVGATCLE